ncbi:MAG TPA: multicopper oxidase domain-containing protein [Nitrolancea sp.]|nr:multicopper oxidase domain-containing protein [Nitrolancea sp.]
MLAAMPVLIIGCSQQADSATEHSTTPHTSAATPSLGTGQARTYYIAADEVDWDYAPDGQNQITGQPFDDAANVFVENGPDRIGKVYHKSLYREYTDQSFTTRKEADPKWQHLGMLGPAIHAEVGDSIQIVFKNNTQFPASMHPHGVFYQKNAEGAPYNDGTSGADQDDDAVAPGETYTYQWEVPERAGPGPHDQSSAIWMYHSHMDEIADGYAGLVGPMIITRQGSANPDGSPNDVDREFVTMFSVIDENASPYLEKNIKDFAQQPDSVKPDDEGFGESNLMHSINGYVYGNLPGLTMKQGERVRWYVLGMGNEVDLHTPHWHGQTLLMSGMRMDMVELLPMSMKVLDMTPDNPGTWLYHCHVNDHIQAGMQARFTITP